MSRWLACTIAILAAAASSGIVTQSSLANGTAAHAPGTPKDFADQLVALYGRQSHTREESAAWDRWHDSLFDPAFSKLIADNRAIASHFEAIGLDHDPLCGCQSGSGSFRISSVTLRTDGLAELKAAHCYSQGSPKDDCTHVDLILKRIGGVWKLHDVLEQGSLRDRLFRNNAAMCSAKGNRDIAQCAGR